MGFHFGISRAAKATTSAHSLMEGPVAKMWVPRESYSLMMSFWVVPERSHRPTPARSAAAM